MERKAKVVMSGEVWDKINWLTRNYNKEIGAMGTVKKKNNADGGYFYIEKLLFTKQVVGVANIDITNNMWCDLIKDHYDDLGSIAFYWHKHPGSANHSSTDEEDTFETFMSNEAGRKYFIFLQTALQADGKIDTETRIELRDPRVTIVKDNINLTYEVSEEQQKINKIKADIEAKVKLECEKIIESCVVSPPTQTTTHTGCTYTRGFHQANKKVIDEDYTNFYVDKEETEALIKLFNVDKNYIDNDIIAGIQTGEDEKMSVTFGNGHLKVLCTEKYKPLLTESLSKGHLSSVAGSWKPTERANGMIEFHIQPHKGCYDRLRANMTEEFIRFNDKTLTKVSECLGCCVEELPFIYDANVSGEIDYVETDPAYKDYVDEEDLIENRAKVFGEKQTLLSTGHPEKRFVSVQDTMVATQNEPDLNAQLMADIGNDFVVKYKDYTGTNTTDEAIVSNDKGQSLGIVYLSSDYSMARYVGADLASYIVVLLKEYKMDNLVNPEYNWIAKSGQKAETPHIQETKKLITTTQNELKEAVADGSATKRSNK